MRPLRLAPPRKLVASVFVIGAGIGVATNALAAAAAPASVARAASPAAAAASPGAHGIELAAQIELSEGKSTLMHLPYPVARLAVGDAKIADVILINPSEVYLLGKSTGSTNLILWNRANQATIVDIAVGLDTTQLRKQFEQFFPSEKDIRITVSGNSIILSGEVADAVRDSQILALATAYLQRKGSVGANGGGNAAMAAVPALGSGGTTGGPGGGNAGAGAADNQPAQAGGGKVINMMTIGAPQQVMLEVKIAEISKSLVDKLGANVGATFTNGSSWTYSLLSNLLSGNPSSIGATNTKNGNLLTIDAQKTDGLVKVLAEPTVMAISGQEASFLAGGKIFIPVAQNSGGVTSITLEEKEYGVAVKFTPTVLDGGRINLKVSPEVSSLDRDGVAITAAGGTATSVLPSFTTRRASTTVQLLDGQSFAIGGLIQNNVTTSISAFPMLGELPIVGALFRSSEFQKDRTELVFIVTPHLARPLAPDHKLPTDAYIEPSRAEFFLGGKLESGSAPASPVIPPPAATGPASGPDVK
jgi:pilus assembly protein CpaC